MARKPTKRERNNPGRLIPVDPARDKPFKVFLDAIPRDLLMGALQIQPETSRLRLLFELMNAEQVGPHPPLLVALCRKAGVSMQEIMNLLRDTAIAEGTVKMMLSLPQVMEDVGEDAKTKARTCSECRGVGRVPVPDPPNREIPFSSGEDMVCLNCEGTGKVREIGDKHARDLMFESAELTNKPRGPLINQNFDMRDTQLKQVLAATQDLLEPTGKR